MANNYGRIYLVVSGKTPTATDAENSYFDGVLSVMTNIANKILGNPNSYGIDAFYTTLSSAKELTGSINNAPSVFYIVDDTKRVFLLQGNQPKSNIEGFFTAIFSGKVDQNGQANSDNGGSGTWGFPLRPCIPLIDDSLKWLLEQMGLDAKTIAEYKKYVLLGGAGLMGFWALNSAKRIGQVGYGAGAAALAALALMPVDPSKPCK